MSWWDSIIGAVTDTGTDSGGGGGWWDSILDWGSRNLASNTQGTGSTWLDRYSPLIALGGKVIGSGVDYFNQKNALEAQQNAANQWQQWMQQNSAANQAQYQDYLSQYYPEGGSGFELVGTDPKEIDAARIAALQEAQTRLEAGYSDALKTLAPYRKSALSILPRMQKAYTRGVKGMDELYADVFDANPETQSALSQKLGFDEFVRGKRK